MDGEFDLVTCEYCLGQFVPEDMQGEHCLDCAEELFGEVDQ